MNEEAFFDFEQEIIDQYVAQSDDAIDWDDYSFGGTEVESYDP